MDVRAYVLPILTIFVLVGAFGAFAFMAPMHMEVGCPFMLGQTALCSTNTLTHVNHWQLAFASILVDILLLLTLAIIVLSSRREHVPKGMETYPGRIRARHEPERMTLFQELFSRGILNRKEPSLML